MREENSKKKTEARYLRISGYLHSFFTDYLCLQRDLSINTVRTYRDAWRLLLEYGQEERGMGPPQNWRIYQINRQLILEFLVHLEEKRKVTPRTRNNRLAAIHAFFHHLRLVEPELDSQCRRILAIPPKRCKRATIDFLESDELQAVIESVPEESPTAYRDRALLVFAYNTGARVHEIAGAKREHIIPGAAPCIRILGKGNKERVVPLWNGTLNLLELYIDRFRSHPRTPAYAPYLFLSSRGRPLSRFQVGRIITRYIHLAAERCPSLRKKRLCAHSMRHTTACHLLQAGAELNTIKAWLGHASVESTQVYIDLDLRKKGEVLQDLITPELVRLCSQSQSHQQEGSLPLMDWLNTL
ncbi:integrase [bacterium]|nr:MAG: integrase [bacterium]